MRVLSAADSLHLDDDLLVLGDNLDVLPRLPGGAFDLISIDPPFNTGRAQVRGGRRYEDAYDDYPAFLRPRLEQARRLLAVHGTLYVHLDPRESHYVKVLLDELFGRECFLNEIVWAYDYGARTKRRWPPKHDTILVYVRDPRAYWFDAEAVDREPYMAPGLQRSAERVARGKLPTSVWWHTIVPTTSREKTGYPTQKPEGIVRRMVAASSRPGGWCLDFFAGSGTLGAVCAQLGRRFVLVDSNPEAIRVARERLDAGADAAA
ncbi:MAG TPA: site-specific DNA-methyltransferase [Solirubrobacteraceae bacterium]|jgi:site-specific DNA-methyltransferase (adenine-specific)|nr:site-specific DNA-methyltransferase [Solirubrobacteraceae bacterium]